MGKIKRTLAELIEASEHLQYEINMVCGTASELAAGVPSGVLRNALIESFTIHVRALLSFLYDDKKFDDDLVAGDYVPDWSSKRPPKPAALGHAQFRVGKEIAHLTYNRLFVTDQTRGWDYPALAKEMLDTMLPFVRVAPDSFLGPKMAARKSEMLKSASAI
jgi:hypothetical protein